MAEARLTVGHVPEARRSLTRGHQGSKGTGQFSGYLLEQCMRTKRSPQILSALEHASLGALTRIYPPAMVEELVRECGRQEARRRLLPARLVVYFVIALALFSDSGYREVMQKLSEGLRQLHAWVDHWSVPTSAALTIARQRLGAAPLRALFDKIARPIATLQTCGSWYRQWRLCALDGTVLDLPDTEDNDKYFGRPGSSRGERSSYPQVHVVSLAECGTHVHFDYATGPLHTGETTLARQLLRALTPGMLCLADRNFFSFDLWNAARATGAELLWRVRKNLILEPEQRLADGSYLSHIYPSTDARQPKRGGVLVRVIEYTLDDPGRPSLEIYRLLTSVLDPQGAPADELAVLYCERQEFEIAEDEFKTHLRGMGRVLRSHTPEGVEQEICGYFLAHYAVRVMMHEAALKAGIDPQRLSFTHTVHVIQRKIIGRRVFSPLWVVPPEPTDPAGDR